MAKATAKCTCKTCGATFIMTKTCFNRSDADNWESWAVANYDECTDCWKARKSKENANVGIDVYVLLESNAIILRAVKEWDFYSIKSDVKKAGFEYRGHYWERVFPIIDFANMSDDVLEKMQSDDNFVYDYIPKHVAGQSAKAKEFAFNALETINKANALTGNVIDKHEVFSKVNANNFAVSATTLNATKRGAETELKERNENRAKREEKQAHEKALADAKPEWLEGKYWNGKIYGKNKNEVYLSNEKKVLNNDELAQLKKYIELKNK